jgi:hypothetical protein
MQMTSPVTDAKGTRAIFDIVACEVRDVFAAHYWARNTLRT